MNQADSAGGPSSGSITFTTFVLSLSTAALQHLGFSMTGDETASDENLNLPLAQQTIDILAMLQEKTTGNLSEDEEKLLGNVLYDLRMRYVDKSQGASG